MRVAAVQFKAKKGDKRASLERLVRLAETAAAGADLVVLPEMAATGYVFGSPAAVGAVAEEARGETFEALRRVARGRCWLVAGLPERAGDRYFNSAIVVDPRGELAFTYRKTLLYEADLPWATPGDTGYRSFDTPAGAFGVGICMDLNDDRFTAWLRAAALTAVAFPTNWVEDHEGQSTWPYWAERIEGTRAALVAANTWGAEGDVLFSGRSAVLSGGAVLASAPWTGDAVIRADLP